MGLTVEELSKKYGATFTPAPPSLSGSSLVSPALQSLASKYGATVTPPQVKTQPDIFAGTKQSLSDIISDPLTLKANPKQAISNAWDTIKGSVSQEGTRINDFVNSFGKTPGPGEEIGTGLQAVTGAANVVFSPISALFAGAEQIPVLGTVAKLVSLPFTAVGEAGAGIGSGIVDQLPISQEAKDQIKPGVKEIFSLAGQLALGKGIDLIKKGQLETKYGTQDANTIVNEATKLAEQKNPTIKQPTTIETPVVPTTPPTMAEQIAPLYNAKVEPKTPSINKPTVSGVANQIQTKAIEQGFVDKGLTELPGYDASTIKKQAEIGAQYSPDQLFEIAKTGNLPEGMKAGTPLSILEDIYKNDPEKLNELAKSPLTSKISESASEVSLSRMREKGGTVENIRQVLDARKEQFKEPLKNEVKTLSETIKKVKPTKDAWLSFIDEIKCT